ncbi:hypothetical protein [Noviherbaspirillum cavernae]|uniref:hypothetical protein n=1 Tax=Noviherbaspirillum cavernae TaxID=2320862 RepID=UPI0018F2C933|nr:hypothetical protein [Noviherbaspirillum cavernae]
MEFAGWAADASAAGTAFRFLFAALGAVAMIVLGLFSYTAVLHELPAIMKKKPRSGCAEKKG